MPFWITTANREPDSPSGCQGKDHRLLHVYLDWGQFSSDLFSSPQPFGFGSHRHRRLARLPLGHLLRKVLVVLPFLFVVALSIPFMKTDALGGGYNLGLGGFSISRSGLWVLWNVVIKSCLGVFSVILLSSTTSFPQLIRGMEKLGSPRIFTMLTSFMYRYSFILIDEMHRIKRARDSRCFGGRWFWQTKVMGHMIGTLFLRSFHRGERVYMAMLSRGYQGTMPETKARRLGCERCSFSFLLLFSFF